MLWLTVQVTVPHIQGVTAAEAWGSWSYLIQNREQTSKDACIQGSVHFLHGIQSRMPCRRNGVTYFQAGSLTSMNTIKTSPHRCTKGQPDLNAFSLRLPSRVSLGYVKLIIKTNYHTNGTRILWLDETLHKL